MRGIPPMTDRGFVMLGRLLAIDIAWVRRMSTKPAASSAVLFACSHLSTTSKYAIGARSQIKGRGTDGRPGWHASSGTDACHLSGTH